MKTFTTRKSQSRIHTIDPLVCNTTDKLQKYLEHTEYLVAVYFIDRERLVYTIFRKHILPLKHPLTDENNNRNSKNISFTTYVKN